jgi:hypothetical protein
MIFTCLLLAIPYEKKKRKDREEDTNVVTSDGARMFVKGMPNENLYMQTGKIYLAIWYSIIKIASQFGTQLLNSIIPVLTA